VDRGKISASVFKLEPKRAYKTAILGNIMYFLRKMAVSFDKTDKIALLHILG
jgi:hypothetical protein